MIDGSNSLKQLLVIYGNSILKQMLICRVIVYQLWSGLPVANANSNVEKEDNAKKVEAQGVMQDDGQGEDGHGDDGQEDNGQVDVGQGEVGHGGGGRRQSGEGGRNL